MELYEHNDNAVKAVMYHFKYRGDRAAVVHACGTGKSFIIGAVAQHYKSVLVIAPLNFILDETRKVCHKGVTFMTYYSVMLMKDIPQFGLIVLDEFHRAGAEKWSEGVQRVLDANPQADVLGTSATPIRYLDHERNMADEIFDGKVVSTITLKEAMERGILPFPTYVASLYTMDDEQKRIAQRIQRCLRPEEWKEERLRKLDGLAHNWQNAGGVSGIIRKYITHDMQRIIVFCSKVRRAAEARELLSKWFGLAGFNRVRYYNIDYKEKRLEKEMEDFQEPLGDYDLKVAISVNMLNEGVHIPNVNAVIMMRSTISRNIMEQQVGRCLSAGKTKVTPVVLDLVNNLECINDDHGDDVFDMLRKRTEEHEKHEKKTKKPKNGFCFTVHDDVRDICEMLRELNEEAVSYTKWTLETVREEALKYQTRISFYRGNPSAYGAATRNGWLDDVCSHMQQTFTFWTREMLEEEIGKYTTLQEFRVQCPNGYAAARRFGIMEELTSHLERQHVLMSKEMVIKEAKKYKTRMEFQAGCPRAYQAAQRLKCLDEVCAHMDDLRHQWTKEECAAEAQKYNTRTEFHNGSPKAYAAATSHKWMDDICGHMQRAAARKSVNKWTYDLCLNEARQCKNFTDFKVGHHTAHLAAYKNKWLDDIKKEMGW